jgi:hypothetical protein
MDLPQSTWSKDDENQPLRPPMSEEYSCINQTIGNKYRSQKKYSGGDTYLNGCLPGSSEVDGWSGSGSGIYGDFGSNVCIRRATDISRYSKVPSSLTHCGMIELAEALTRG